MEKTILYTKSHSENFAPHQIGKATCKNCQKLQQKLTEMNNILSEKQQQIRNFIETKQQSLLKRVQEDLYILQDKFITLKKKIKIIEKQNDQLFNDNTLLENQLRNLKKREINYQKQDKENEQGFLQSDKTEDGSVSSGLQVSRIDKKYKQLLKTKELELSIEKEKLTNFEKMVYDQNSELSHLRKILRKRNQIQQQRHQLLVNCKQITI